ncbi:MAG: T9SS type A sorting domain-containing protein [Patescibacteria group bacterium]
MRTIVKLFLVLFVLFVAPVMALYQQGVSLPTQWTNVSSEIDLYAIETLDGVNVYAAGGAKILCSHNGGQTWTKPVTDDVWFKGIKVFDNNNVLVYGGAYGDGVIYQTTDGGQTWTINRLTGLNLIMSMHFLDRLNGWITSYDVVEINLMVIRIHKTTDGGQTWTLAHSFISSYRLRSIWAVNQNTVIAAGDSARVIITTNAGVTWNKITMPSAGLTTSFESIVFTNNSTGLIAGNQTSSQGNYVFKTTDGGKTWTIVFGNKDYYIYHLQMLDSNNGYAVGQVGKWNPGRIYGALFKTTDGGNNWQEMLANGDNNAYYGVSFINQESGFIAGLDGIYKYQNHWPKFNITSLATVAYVDSTYRQKLQATDVDGDSLRFSLVNSPVFLHIVDSTITGKPTTADTGSYLITVVVSDGKGGTDTLKYNLKVDKLTGIDDSQTVPVTYSLSQNYPNPFNPSTTIVYSIPTSCQVKLQVLDILGREIVELVNEQKFAGSYEVVFSAQGGSASGGNASNLPSGIYFYRLQAGNFVSTKKMMYLK